MKRYCIKCNKLLSKNGYTYCRSCYEEFNHRTKRFCTSCNSPLSKSASLSGGKYCRKCWLSSLKDNRLYWQNYEWLYKHYITNKMSTAQIASKVNAYTSRIGWWLHKLNIPVRSNAGVTPYKYTDKKQYVNIWLPDHPTASKSRPYKREHVLVMEKHLGKILSRKEKVHHLNGIKDDNRLENLMYFPNQSLHMAYEAKIISFAKQLIWGNLKPELKSELQELFTQYLSKNE